MTEGMPTRDHFPTTHATWLSDRVGVANDEVARHIMERYFEPLRAYVKGSSLRNFGDSADLVNDFFASDMSESIARIGGSVSGCTPLTGCRARTPVPSPVFR
jgi:hypothetical protein